ncbi:MAG: nodulation protein NfeD [Chloroflexota bacterium]
MKTILRICLLLTFALTGLASARAQTDAPLVIVINVDGPIMPAMEEYVRRGLRVAEQRGAEALILQLDTPGGHGGSMLDIMQAIRNSDVAVVVYVAPNGAQAASAGAMITMAGRAAAMAPETVIGASSPISSTGENLESTAEAKAKNDTKAAIRPLVTPRGERALALAESMIDEAVAVTSDEALEAGLIDFIARDLDELLEKLDGFTVEMNNGARSLETTNALVESLPMSFIEELLMLLTNPAIVLFLVGVGIQAVLIEISSPGGWVAGFIGVVCITLGVYGAGYLPLNWFGIIFLVTAFVLFILDIKAPTHGALTAAGVASFIVGALVLFNSPGTPDFARVPLPAVILLAAILGVTFAVIVGFGVRALRRPVTMGVESMAGKTGTARTWSGVAGQVQMDAELWSAESVPGSEPIRKGDTVEVVEVKGLRLKVKKK